jgi:predicted nucleotidyltransferase
VSTHVYPTPEHAAAAEAIRAFFASRPEPGAVVLVNSVARGTATPESDLDMVVLVPPGQPSDDLSEAWEQFRATDPRIAALLALGPLAALHLDIEEATIDLPDHPADEYPDWFELMIGNWLVRGIAIWERDGFHQALRSEWLTFYDDALRLRRLAEVRATCVEQLDHIPGYVDRELYFQAFARLWRAFQLFLQALFLSRRVYTISYDKWIREQVEGIPGLPELYVRLPGLFEISRFESDEVVAKAVLLRSLLDAYVPEGATAVTEPGQATAGASGEAANGS